MGIVFHSRMPGLRIRHKRKIAAWMVEVARKERHEVGEIGIVFCDSRDIRRLNRKYLAHDRPTDIISFPYSEPGEALSGDLFVGIPVIKENAAAYAVGFGRELCRVLIHGLLHLSGYEDKTGPGRKDMRAAEDKYLAMADWI